MPKTFQEVFTVPIELEQSYRTPHAASVPFVDAARALQAKIDNAFPKAIVVYQTITVNLDELQLEAVVMFETIQQGA